jgi:hypothetical protein
MYDPQLGFDPDLGLEGSNYQNPYQGQQGSLVPKGANYGDLITSIGKKIVAKKLATAAAAKVGLTGGSTVIGGSVGPTMAAASPYAAMPGTEAFLAGSSATSAAAPASTLGLESAGSTVGLPAAAAIAAALEGRSALRMAIGKSKNWKEASLSDNAGRALLAASTFGGSEALNYLKNNLLGRHRTTRQIAKGNTSELRKMGEGDDNWQQYVSGMRDQYASNPTDKEHPFAGKYKTFDEYKKAGLQADDLTGVHGNLKTFGPDWAKLSFDDQKKVTQGVIDAGLYNSKKGEVEITDAEKAKKILAEAIAKKK